MYKGELFNTITHLVGAVAAVSGTAVLIVSASLEGDPWKVVSFSIYGATLIILYLFSTLYHGMRGKAKGIFRKFDHTAIYLLIAGTYTPFTLVTLRGPWGWSLFGAVWGLAAAGMLIDIFHKDEKRFIPVVIYVIMGWLVITAIKPLRAALPASAFGLLLAGGLLYTGGIVFYALDKRLAHSHGIWHLFVLAGSISHFIAVFLYVR